MTTRRWDHSAFSKRRLGPTQGRLGPTGGDSRGATRRTPGPLARPSGSTGGRLAAGRVWRVGACGETPGPGPTHSLGGASGSTPLYRVRPPLPLGPHPAYRRCALFWCSNHALLVFRKVCPPCVPPVAADGQIHPVLGRSTALGPAKRVTGAGLAPRTGVYESSVSPVRRGRTGVLFLAGRLTPTGAIVTLQPVRACRPAFA